MKFRDKIKNKVKQVKNFTKQQSLKSTLPKTFDQSNISVQFINSQLKTQLTQIRIIAQWLEKYGHDQKGEQRPIRLNCKWFRRSDGDIEEIKNKGTSYQLSLEDVGRVVQAECVPEVEGMEYEGMPLSKLVGPVILDNQTIEETNELMESGRGKFFVKFKELNVSSSQQDQQTIKQGLISISCNSLMQIYGKKSGTNMLLCSVSLDASSQGSHNQNKQRYPEVIIVADSGKMISLLINEQNDFVSVEFDSNKVRDVFCLLLSRIRENGVRKGRGEGEIQAFGEEIKVEKEEIVVGEEIKEEIKEEINEEITIKDGKTMGVGQITEERDQTNKGQAYYTNQREIIENDDQQLGQKCQEINRAEANQMRQQQYTQHQTQQQALNEINRDNCQQNKPSLKTVDNQQQPSPSIQQPPNPYQTNSQQHNTSTPPTLQQHNSHLPILTTIQNKQIIQQEPQPQQQPQQQQQQKQQPIIQQCIINDNHPNQIQSTIQQQQQATIIKQQQQQQVSHHSTQNVQQQSVKEVELQSNQATQQNQSMQQVKERQQLKQQQQQQQQANKAIIGKNMQVEWKERQELSQIMNKQVEQNKTAQLLQLNEEFNLKLQHQLSIKENKLKHQLELQLRNIIQLQLKPKLEQQLKPKIQQQLRPKIQQQLRPIIEKQLKPKLQQQLKPKLQRQIKPVLQKELRSIIQKQLRPIIQKQLRPRVEKQLRVVIQKQLRPRIQFQLKPKIELQLKPKIEQQLRPIISKQLRPIISDQLKPMITNQLKPIISNQLKPMITEQVKPIIRKQLRPMITDQLRPIITKQLRPIIQQQLRPIITNQLRPIIRNQLKPIITNQLRPIIRNQLKPSIQQQLYPRIEQSLRPVITRKLFGQKQQKLMIQAKPCQVTIQPSTVEKQSPQLRFFKNQNKLAIKQNGELLQKTRKLQARILQLQNQISLYHPHAQNHQPHQHPSPTSPTPTTPPAHTPPPQPQHPTSQPITKKQLTPYQSIKQQLHKSSLTIKQLQCKNSLLVEQKESMEEELMKYKVELEELQAMKKHLEKKYDSLSTEIQVSTAINNSQNTIIALNSPNISINQSQQILLFNNNSNQSSPLKSPTKQLKSMKSLSSILSNSPMKQQPLQQYPQHLSLKKTLSTQPKQPQPVNSTQYQRLSQAILNHYSTEQQLSSIKKQLQELSQENTQLRSIIYKEKKSSILSSGSSKHLKLELLEMKKLANRLTEELTEKNLLVENMKLVNKEINSKLLEITKQYHIQQQNIQ